MRKIALFMTASVVSTAVFGLMYYFIARTHGSASEKKKSLPDHLWFSLLTQTTVGYGYDTGMTGILKVINGVQLMNLFLVTALTLT
jgi:hypothetical protein